MDRFNYALAPGWWTLTYANFLEDRRDRVAKIVKKAWECLRGGPIESSLVLTPAELIAGGETEWVEFKSTNKSANWIA